MPPVQRDHNVVTTVEALDRLVDDYLAEDAFAFDVETLPGPGGAPRVDVRRNTVAWLSLSTYGRADVIPFCHPHGELESIEHPLTASGKARKALWESEGKAEKWKPRKAEISNDLRKATYHWSPAPEQLDIHEAFGHLKRLLLSDRTKIGHNLKFDLCSVEKYLGEFPAGPYFDTMVGAYLVNSGHYPREGYPRPYALNAVCKREVGYDMVKGVGAEIEAHGFRDVARYSWLDSRYTWLTYRRLVRQLKRDGLRPLMALEMDVLEVLCHMEKQGAHIDPVALAELDRVLTHKVGEAKLRVLDMAPDGFNVDSTPQKQRLLYDPKPNGRGLTPKAYTKTGAPSTASEALEPYRNRDKLVGALLDYADLAKLQGTYVQAYARTVPEKKGSKTYYPMVVNGRIHADFNQIGAQTGRFSCREPNLQNCVPGDVQVLTEAGWIRFDLLADSTPVAQWVDDKIEFVVPDRVHRINYSGDLVEMRSAWGTFAYTPEHRVVSETRGGMRLFETADYWRQRWPGETIIDRRMIRAGRRVGGRVLSAEERRTLAVAVCVQADGHRTRHSYDVACRSARKIAQLTELFGDERVRTCADRSRVRVSADEVGPWLDDSKEKNFVASAVLSLCADDLDFFLSQVRIWDGDFTRGATYTQHPDREASVDVVQAAACLTGQSTSFYRREHAVCVNMHRSSRRWASRIALSDVPYSGGVYCVTVSSGMFVIRSNGAVLVTGNCPSSGTENGKAIRSLFVAPPEHKLVVADYSQIEPRVIASLSGDPTMVAAYRNGEDIYTAIATPLGLDRKAGKTLVLALGYGIGADSVADRLGVGLRKAQKIMSDFDERFSSIARYKAEVIKEARRQQPPHVTTLYGRRRYLFDLWSTNPGRRAAAERQAFNTVIQGSAADINKAAIVRTHKSLPEGCHLILSVHDELVVEAPDDLVGQAEKSLRTAMEDIEIPGFLVPLVAEIHTVANWGSAK